MKIHSLLALLALLALPAAATPTTMTYVGVLEDNGAPVNDTVDASFRLFPAATGGTALYEEQSTNLIVIGGDFVVELGQNALDDAVLEQPELWLEVEIDGEVMTPRVRLNSVPYALRAALAEVAQLAEETLTFGGLQPLDYVTQQQLQTLGLHQGINAGAGLTKTNGTLALASGGVALANLASNSVDASKIVDGSVGANELASNAVTTVKIQDGAVTAAKISGTVGLFQVTAVGCAETVGTITTSNTCGKDTAGCSAGQVRDCVANTCGNSAILTCGNIRVGTILP